MQAATPATTTSAPQVADLPEAMPVSRLDLVARQQNATPLLARLVAVAARPDLPVEVRQAALRVLATRVALDRGAPDGETLRSAMLRATGVSSDPDDTPSLPEALGQLRATLGRLIASGAALRPGPVARHAPPPIVGDPPEAASAQSPLPADGDRADLVRHLAADTDGAIARHRLLALPPQPGEARPAQPTTSGELRVEVPMLLAGETGMVQFVLERDARRGAQKRERGWRMRFAMSFSALGEVGADVGLIDSSARVALWAVRGEVAEALSAMSEDLAPALARHGLTLAGFRLRHGAPQHASRNPGRLVDGAR